MATKREEGDTRDPLWAITPKEQAEGKGTAHWTKSEAERRDRDNLAPRRRLGGPAQRKIGGTAADKIGGVVKKIGGTAADKIDGAVKKKASEVRRRKIAEYGE